MARPHALSYYDDQLQAERIWLGGLPPDAAPKIAWNIGATLFALK